MKRELEIAVATEDFDKAIEIRVSVLIIDFLRTNSKDWSLKGINMMLFMRLSVMRTWLSCRDLLLLKCVKFKWKKRKIVGGENI